MSDESAFLAALAASPADPLPRLAYADWLEERADPRHELVRVCEAMRQVPVFSDEYWRLKARRNELRPAFAADWLAATGCDGSRYDAIFRDGVPDGWRERWRLIREFTERWHGIPMPDVGGRVADIAATEERLGLTLPPSVREYVAYAHDVSVDSDYLRLNRDPVTMVPIPGHDAVSISVISEGDWHWGIRLADFNQPDPPVYNYAWRDDAMPEEVREQGQAADSITRFVLNDATAYKPSVPAPPMDGTPRARTRGPLAPPSVTAEEGDDIPF
jgi:uncharacterized protein (TIGR02996 family)